MDEMKLTNAQRASVLVQALPYIQKYYGKIVVIKYGGNAMLNEELKSAVMGDLALLSLIGVKVVLVHGGGPEITDMLARVGKKTEFVNGLRVTDAETAEIVQMVLAGKINKSLVNKLENIGANAIGLSGADGHMIEAAPLSPALGYVGEITADHRYARKGIYPRYLDGRMRPRGKCVQHQRGYRRRTSCGGARGGKPDLHD